MLGKLWQFCVTSLERVVITLFALLVGAVLWGVVSRYMPGVRPSDWTEELSIHLLLWVSLLGAALAYRAHGHLGVDYFVGLLDPAARRVAAVVAECTVLGFAAFAFVYGGLWLVRETLAVNQMTAVLQWKAGYVYLAVPISGVFLCAFSVEHLLQRPNTPTSEPKDI